MTKDNTVTSSFMKFLDSSPTAWHAVEESVKELKKAGFVELKEHETWKVHLGKSYYVVRNGSSLCAFILPAKAPEGLHIAASHTDSPAFKIKPNADFIKENMRMIGLEVYGGPLLASWLNRDLGIAGRVIYTDKKGKQHEALVRLDDHPVTLPQLAIHLDRNVNENGLVLNKQEHLAALAGLDSPGAKGTFLERALKDHLPISELLAYDLFLFPIEPAKLGGEHKELLSSYRIDNLVSAYASLHALIDAKKPDDHLIKAAVFWDNEEIGSNTAQGAGSPFLPQIIERVALALKIPREEFLRWTHNSLCLSIDVGHAVHPSYADKHEPRHAALLGKGVLVKTNAQNRYSSDARSFAAVIALCNSHKIPFQKYVSRGDIPCGTTVGPIHANLTGMPTIDIGIPQLSMHSCRELVSTKDHLSLCKLLTAFFQNGIDRVKAPKV